MGERRVTLIGDGHVSVYNQSPTADISPAHRAPVCTARQICGRTATAKLPATATIFNKSTTYWHWHGRCTTAAAFSNAGIEADFRQPQSLHPARKQGQTHQKVGAQNFRSDD
jgi:hypothetical protein